MDREKYIDRIRIYFNDAYSTVAECHFLDGNTSKIYWCDIEKRKEMLSYINGYTLLYDERINKEWS